MVFPTFFNLSLNLAIRRETQIKTTMRHHLTLVRMVIIKKFTNNKCWRGYGAKGRPGTDCGSDHELLIAKFRLKLKKGGKTTTSFRYDLNQIPYDYTVEVRNRFKGLDLIDRVPDELWNEVLDIV